MIRNYLLVALFGILVHFPARTVSHEAIMGGKETGIKPFRYAVSLLEEDVGHICGGALIGQQFVLSAAHCFTYADNSFKSKRVYALMGTADLMKMESPAVNYEVSIVHIPINFNAANINTSGDISVLKLKVPIPILHLINLHTVRIERLRNQDHTGEMGKIAGWGWNTIHVNGFEVTGRRTDSLLRYTHADVLDNHHCQIEHSRLKISDDHLCARAEQHEHETSGVCHGDDGDALVFDDFVIGVLSKFPNSCDERRNVAVYTRVSHYITFIRNAKAGYITKNMRIEVLAQ